MGQSTPSSHRLCEQCGPSVNCAPNWILIKSFVLLGDELIKVRSAAIIYIENFVAIVGILQ